MIYALFGVLTAAVVAWRMRRRPWEQRAAGAAIGLVLPVVAMSMAGVFASSLIIDFGGDIHSWWASGTIWAFATAGLYAGVVFSERLFDELAGSWVIEEVRRATAEVVVERRTLTNP